MTAQECASEFALLPSEPEKTRREYHRCLHLLRPVRALFVFFKERDHYLRTSLTAFKWEHCSSSSSIRKRPHHTFRQVVFATIHDTGIK